MLEFYMIYARKKINKMPIFYMIFARKNIFSEFFFFGGGQKNFGKNIFAPAPLPPYPTPMPASSAVVPVEWIVRSVLHITGSSRQSVWVGGHT